MEEVQNALRITQPAVTSIAYCVLRIAYYAASRTTMAEEDDGADEDEEGKGVRRLSSSTSTFCLAKIL